ncbi:hypothetical protein TNCV_2447321 [Trichonephila clavipes]|uniref:Uncharacterized protein n=1 Tax=Trichonephila clavipes TaxID=2585209 RepID=A0A8X6SHZ3_TRICX|nr:hypothetical protein TNCV_2447321 [Trichonephila clavipes]
MVLKGRGICTRDSAHKMLGPTDLTSTYSVCTRRAFGDIGHRTQAFRSGLRCTTHYATHGSYVGYSYIGPKAPITNETMSSA